MTEEKLQAVVINGIEVPCFPVHGQSFERSVKLVTEAASAVVRWEKRDGCIRVRRAHRKELPQLNKKSDFFRSEQMPNFYKLFLS